MGVWPCCMAEVMGESAHTRLGLRTARLAVLEAAAAVSHALVEITDGYAEALSSARLVFCTLSVA